MFSNAPLINLGLGPQLRHSPYRGELWLPDNYGVSYLFHLFDIGSQPDAEFSVYGFFKHGRPLYIGRAMATEKRLGRYSKHLAAIDLGADAIGLHTPHWLDPVPYEDAERRLIDAHWPVLNDQFNPAV